MKSRKGIILAGGSGSRLFPVTKAISKQLIPIHDKPMIYYPLSTLMLTGIKDILIISTPIDNPRFKSLLGDGSSLGINIHYAVQESPKGIADAFLVAESFISNDPCCLILGDNIFYGNDLSLIFNDACKQETGATVFAYHVDSPENYGVLELDKEENPISIEEKPSSPLSNWAVTGLYLFDNRVVEIAKSLKPSDRGELEITSINQNYLENKELEVKFLGRGYAWLDTGTHESILEASQFISSVEIRQGLKISCPEEIAWRMGYIDSENLLDLALAIGENQYGLYLKKLVEGN